MPTPPLIALDDFLKRHSLPCSLIEIFMTLAKTCNHIADKLHQSSLSGTTGHIDSNNVQGEQQKKMDVISNDLLKEALLSLSQVQGIASEEETLPIPGHPSGHYLVAFDPLDGSSNLDINVSVGTIFSIFEPESSSLKPASLPHTDAYPYLISGEHQIAAGYFLYGPSLELVMTFGQGTHKFTYNTTSLRFELTQECIHIPNQTQEFAINMSNQRFWEPPVQSYIYDLIQGEEGPIGKRFNMRWIASMVAEVHRVLNRGGIFMYPKDSRTPNQPGKLRLLYEGSPMAMIVEQAGGRCSNAYQRIMTIRPQHLHERVAIFLGSQEEVERAESYHQSHGH